MWTAYILTGRQREKRTFCRPRYGWEDYIGWTLKNLMKGVGAR
jgi:hypothetical protein